MDGACCAWPDLPGTAAEWEQALTRRFRLLLRPPRQRIGLNENMFDVNESLGDVGLDAGDAFFGFEGG